MSVTASLPVLAERVAAVRERVALACRRVGRDPGSVALIAVSKTQPPEQVAAGIEAGLTDFGENRVQEALAKMGALAGIAGLPASPAFHLIGHLQTNKVRAVADRFAILHAIDSERLLISVDAASSAPQRVMIEVNVAAEPTKFGVSPAELSHLVAVAAALPHIRLEGLMTVAPPVLDPEHVRPIFRELRRLAGAQGLASISMGMSNDFEVAIEEGATHIRVGRAIFGERVP